MEVECQLIKVEMSLLNNFAILMDLQLILEKEYILNK